MIEGLNRYSIFITGLFVQKLILTCGDAVLGLLESSFLLPAAACWFGFNESNFTGGIVTKKTKQKQTTMGKLVGLCFFFTSFKVDRYIPGGLVVVVAS